MQVDRPNKRARVLPETADKPAKPQSTARLFAPFRALGFISNDVPFALQIRGTKGGIKGPNVNVVSCLGRSWAMWDAGKMNLLFVGMLPLHQYTGGHVSLYTLPSKVRKRKPRSQVWPSTIMISLHQLDRKSFVTSEESRLLYIKLQLRTSSLGRF